MNKRNNNSNSISSNNVALSDNEDEEESIYREYNNSPIIERKRLINNSNNNNYHQNSNSNNNNNNNNSYNRNIFYKNFNDIVSIYNSIKLENQSKKDLIIKNKIKRYLYIFSFFLIFLIISIYIIKISISNNNFNINNNNIYKINSIKKIYNNNNNLYEYCNNFNNNNNNNNNIYNKSNNSNNNDKCSFNINSPDYSCTPISKKRLNNFRYEFNNYNNNNFKPLVSVIIPFYNTKEEYLNECLESILINQSFKSIEVILVDDGSTKKESIQAYRKWKKIEPIRFKVYVNLVNKGLPHSRNIGVYHSTSNYIFFFDSDDILEPTSIEKMYLKLSTSNHIQFTKGFTIGFKSLNYTWTKGFEERTLFRKDNPITFSIMYKRLIFGQKLNNITIIKTSINSKESSENYQLIENQDNEDIKENQDDSFKFKYDYPDELLEFQLNSTIKEGMEDWDFHLKCAENGYWGETIPEYFDWYRRKDKIKSEKDWKNQKSNEKQLFINQLKLKYPNIYSKFYFPNPIKNQEYNSYKIQKQLIIESQSNNNIIIKKNNKPRLLLIIPWLNMGGADKFNLNLCKQLVLNNWEITIVTTLQSENPWLSTFQQYCTQDIFLYNDKFLDYSDYPQFICYLINTRSIDITLISNSELGYVLVPFIKKYCPTTKLIDYNHMEEENWRDGGHSRLSISLLYYLDHSLVSSNHLKNWMLDKYLNQLNLNTNGSNNSSNEYFQHHQKQHLTIDQIKEKISVLYINVDENEFKRNLTQRSLVRDIYDIKNEQIVILFAARLTNQKNPIQVLEIIKELKESFEIGDNLFKLLIVGNGPLRANVEEFINKQSLNDIVLILGDVPPSDMIPIISASDIVFLPSENEGISMIFYESMSIGLVPIGSNVGGQNELVSKDCGFLINNNNNSSSSQYIKVLNDLILNPSKLIKMGNNCMKRINSNFKINQMGNLIISSICKLNNNNNNNYNNQKYNNIELSFTPLIEEFTIQSIEKIKLDRSFEKSKKDFNRLYSLEQDYKKLKSELDDIIFINNLR